MPSQSRRVRLRRLYHRLRRGRRHGRLRAHQGRRERRDARGGRDVVHHQGLARCSCQPYATPRRGAAIPDRPFGEFDALHRRLGDRRRAVHQGARAPVRLVARPHARRPHESLGPHLAPLRPRRFPRQDASTASATTGRSATTTSSRTTTTSIDLIGLFGSNEGLRNHPDGIFQPPPKPRCYELLVKKASDKLNITCIPARLSIITKPLNGRPACHYCGQCNRGCQVKANFSSTDVLIAPALAPASSRCSPTRWRARSRSDQTGSRRASRTSTRTPAPTSTCDAKVVVLAASACEIGAPPAQLEVVASFPNGLANSSGIVGKYLTDTTGTDVAGFIPALVDHVPHN